MAEKKEEEKEKSPQIKSSEKSPQIETSLLKIKKDKQDLRKEEKPLVDIKVTNPITYIKSWWKKIIGNEGIELKIKVKPLTTIALTIIVITVTLGIGKFTLPFNIPFFQYTLDEDALPSSPPSRETAFSGSLKYDLWRKRYYLITSSAEAITLEVPDNIDLADFVGRRIFATGDYYQESRTLKVATASDMEVLPTKTETIPTIIPTPTPVPSNTPVPTEVPTVAPTVEETPAI